ncbi:hypothetical protein J4462_05160 [Candidatus Pacearchaeota archaeon]|nr:hypothetical protein [Candidatus Pacearchaeota archaeon]
MGNYMRDIFDAKITCKNCNSEMKPILAIKSGFKLRAVQCEKCGDKIIHPGDLSKMEQYNSLKRKTFNVKLRMVGNSHAVSIPKEVIDFIQGSNQRMRKHMNDMVRLCFEDFGRLSLDFFDVEVLDKPHTLVHGSRRMKDGKE